jgi:hypothetical protein
MGSTQSCADMILSLKAVDPAAWPSEAEFRTSVDRIGVGGASAATTDRERTLARFMDVVLTLRDEIINDTADVATQHAVSNTQASNVVAAANVVRSVLVEGASIATLPSASMSAGTNAGTNAGMNAGVNAGMSASTFDDLFA